MAPVMHCMLGFYAFFVFGGALCLVIDIVIISLSSRKFQFFLEYPFIFKFCCCLVLTVLSMILFNIFQRFCLKRSMRCGISVCIITFPFAILLLSHYFWIIVVLIMYPFDAGIGILLIYGYSFVPFSIFVSIYALNAVFCKRLSDPIHKQIYLQFLAVSILSTMFVFFFYYSFVRFAINQDSQNSLLSLLTVIFPSIVMGVIAWPIKKIAKGNKHTTNKRTSATKKNGVADPSVTGTTKSTSANPNSAENNTEQIEEMYDVSIPDHSTAETAQQIDSPDLDP